MRPVSRSMGRRRTPPGRVVLTALTALLVSALPAAALPATAGPVVVAGQPTITAHEAVEGAETPGQPLPSGPTVVVRDPGDPEVRVGARFPPGWRLEAAVEGEAARQVNYLLDDERCELSTRPSAFADPATDIDDFVVSLGPGSGFRLLAREEVELPAGAAERIDIAADEGGQWSVYVVPDRGRMHELWCRADALPDDRWRPIAETLAWGTETAAASSPFDARVDLPAAGVALAFPEAWQVRGSSVRLGLLYATSATAACSLSDYGSLAPEAGWQAVEDMHEAYVRNALDNPALQVGPTAYLELPAGRVGVAELAWDDGTRAVRYSFHESDRWLALFCVAEEVPEGRWDALARSVTWLPAGGGSAG